LHDWPGHLRRSEFFQPCILNWSRLSSFFPLPNGQ